MDDERRDQARPTDESGADVHNTMSGRAETVIQARDIGSVTIHLERAVDPVPVVQPVPPQDQGAPGVFAGRGREVEDLAERLDPDGGPAVVTVLTGMGGVGKTTLARHVAAVAVHRDWFPGGTVIVDLHGYDLDGRPVRPAAVFAPLLSALGLARERMPATEAEQGAVYHDLLASMARRGRRVLLILDNTSSADQVRELLPRSAAHRALVTTRDSLTLPSAGTFELDVPPLEEARAMLEETLRWARPDDDRLGRAPDAAARVVELCGRLPLAVGIAAALLADDTALTPAELADELDQQAGPGDVLRHGESSVDAVFDLSWRKLRDSDPSAARLLPLLVLNPGPHVSTEAAAALADEPVAAVRPRLRRLRGVHLIDGADGHWRMHDLIRTRARGPAGPGTDPSAALKRLIDHYARTAVAEAERLGDHSALSRRRAAMDWFAAERPNLLAAVFVAAVVGHHRRAVELADVLFGVLDEMHDAAGQAAVAQQAVTAAARLDDPEAHVEALHRLGFLRTASGRHAQAADAHRRALELRRASGDRPGEAEALRHLGRGLLDDGRLGEAVTVTQQAGDIFQESGDGEHEAWAVSLLAQIHQRAGRYDKAIAAHRRVISLHEADRETPEDGVELNNLAVTLQQAGRTEEAITAYRRAAEAGRAADRDDVRAAAQDNLALLTGWLGRTEEAITAHNEAVEAYRALGDVSGESTALSNLAAILLRAMEPGRAVAAQQRAIDVCRAAGHRYSEARALSHLARLHSVNGRAGDAIAAHRGAVEIWRDLADRENEGRELKELAASLFEAERYADAGQAAEQAIAALTDCGLDASADSVEEWRKRLPAPHTAEPKAAPPGEHRMPSEHRVTCPASCLSALAGVAAVAVAAMAGPWWLLAALLLIMVLGWGNAWTSGPALAAGVIIIVTDRGTAWLVTAIAVLLFAVGSYAAARRRPPDPPEGDTDRT